MGIREVIIDVVTQVQGGPVNDDTLILEGHFSEVAVRVVHQLYGWPLILDAKKERRVKDIVEAMKDARPKKRQ